MDRFLDTHNFPELSHEVVNNPTRLITRSEIESVVKSLPIKKSPRPDGFIAEFYQIFQEELTPIFHQLFQTI